MISELTYFSIEIIAITATALLGAVVLSSFPKNRSAVLFALICLSKACYLLTRMSFDGNESFRISLGSFSLPMQILMNAESGLWMLFCYSLFQDRKKIPGGLLLFFVIQISLSIGRITLIPMNMEELDSTSIMPATQFLLLTLPLLLQSFIGILALILTMKGWSEDLINGRRIFRGLFLCYFGLAFISITLPEILLPRATSEQRIILNNWIVIFSALSACLILVFTIRLNVEKFDSSASKFVKPFSKKPKALIDNVIEADLEVFKDRFEKHKAYLEHNLTIGKLADNLAIPEYRLRQLIHSKMGFRNFNALLHHYRIKEACNQLSNPLTQKTPILTIALSLGYQSIAPFNKAFREIVGQTPSEYRQSYLSLGGDN